MVKYKISHGKNEKKCEFGSPWNESLGFKCGTLIMLGPQAYLLFKKCDQQVL
jgi:hypothetical protein